MSRFRVTVQLEACGPTTQSWAFESPGCSLEPAHRAGIRDFLDCVGQAIVDDNPSGSYHVLQPAVCAEVTDDVRIEPTTVRVETGLSAGKLGVAISVAEAAARQLPAPPNRPYGTASAIEMEQAAARLLIECGVKNLRAAHALLEPYERHDASEDGSATANER